MSKKISIFGDSISAGYNDFENGGWGKLLNNYLVNKDDSFVMKNYSAPGDDTYDLIQRLDSCDGDQDLAIVAIGVNDSSYIKLRQEYRILLEEFKINLKDILNKIDGRIIFVGLTNVDEEKVGKDTSEFAEYFENLNIIKYDLAIKQFCKDENLLYLPMFEVLENDDMKDGLHPDSEGHEKMFVKVRDFLIENEVI